MLYTFISSLNSHFVMARSVAEPATRGKGAIKFHFLFAPIIIYVGARSKHFCKFIYKFVNSYKIRSNIKILSHILGSATEFDEDMQVMQKINYGQHLFLPFEIKSSHLFFENWGSNTKFMSSLM